MHQSTDFLLVKNAKLKGTDRDYTVYILISIQASKFLIVLATRSDLYRADTVARVSYILDTDMLII